MPGAVGAGGGLVGVPALPSSAAVPCCGHGAVTVLSPSIDLSSLPPSPFAPVPRVVGRFSSPPCPVCPPLVRPLLWLSLQGFCSPWATQFLWGCRCTVATRLPHPLSGWSPVGFPPLWRPCGSPPRPPLCGTCGPLQRLRGPCRCPALLRFAGLNFLPASGPPLLRQPRPMAAPRSRLVGSRGGRFLVLPPPDIVSPDISPTPLSCIPHAVTV